MNDRISRMKCNRCCRLYKNNTIYEITKPDISKTGDIDYVDWHDRMSKYKFFYRTEG